MKLQRERYSIDLYQAQDEVDVKKEVLLEEIETRMEQKIAVQRLFMIRWNIAQDF